MKLKDRIALVTGGGTGIGLAAATAFVAEGAHVIIAGRQMSTLEAALARLGDRAIAIRCDVCRADELMAMYQRIENLYGGLNVLFANAGVAMYAPAEDINDQIFDEIFTANVRSVFFTVQKAIPLLQRGASVILNASIADRMGSVGASVYGASKAAVRSLARGFSAELVYKQVRVNVIAPGPIDIGPRSDSFSRPAEMGPLSVPLGREGRLDEIARVITFLASDDSSLLLGAEIVADGGRSTLPDAAPAYALIGRLFSRVPETKSHAAHVLMGRVRLSRTAASAMSSEERNERGIYDDE